MSHNFFALLSRMKYIDRWALMRNSSREDLSEHSLEVAAIAHALALISNSLYGTSLNAERAAVMGIYHDMPEIITGDMPTPVKYGNEEMRQAYRSVEKAASDRLLSALPDYMSEYYRLFFDRGPEDEYLYKLVKAADKLSALIKCIEEEKAGNTEFRGAKNSTISTIISMDLPPANKFMEDFIPAYSMNLDELLSEEK